MMFQKDGILFKISRECIFKWEIDYYESFENGIVILLQLFLKLDSILNTYDIYRENQTYFFWIRIKGQRIRMLYQYNKLLHILKI